MKIGRMFKKFVVGLMIVLTLCIGAPMVSLAQTTLNLKAVWTPNAEPDIGGYQFNNSTKDGGIVNMYWNTVTQKFDLGSTNPSTLPVSPQILLFPITISSPPDTGTLGFKMRAVDTIGNAGPLSTEAIYNYNIDVTPPLAVTGLTITKQP